VGVKLNPVAPFSGLTNVGVLGGLLEEIVTVRAEDQLLTTELSTAQRAWARTEYVPGLPQDLLALVEELQLEYVPSPQSNRYSTAWPWLQLAPPVENVRDCPTSPEEGPIGVLGVETA